MTKYSELLKHPLWNTRRQEILKRDNFACLCCGTKDKKLNVHHLYYSIGRKPWEYLDSALMSLCDICHESEHNHDELLKNEKAIVRQFQKSGMPASSIVELSEIMELIHDQNDFNVYEIMECVGSVIGYLSRGYLKPSDLLNFLEDQKKEACDE